MSKTRDKKKANGDPRVFRFKAALLRSSQTAKGVSRTTVDFPNWVSGKFPPRGAVTVEGTINGHPFRAPLERNAAGGYWLRVNEAMCAGASAGAGDTVKLAILGPEPAPTVPADLRIAFAAFTEAKALWKDLTPDGRRIWIRWVESAKTDATRARRVRRTIEQLSSGKRRPCCVNVYEFMLERVAQTGGRTRTGT